MINFNQEFKEKSVGPIDAGKYEVAIIKVEQGGGEQGKQKYARVVFKIRDDVKQNFGGRTVSKTLFVDKNPNYAAEGWYNTLAIYYLVNTQPNAKTDFETCDEALAYLSGTKEKKLHLIIEITKDYDDEAAVYRNRVSDFNDKTCLPSEWDKTPHTVEAEVVRDNPEHINCPAGDKVDLPDDDLPF